MSCDIRLASDNALFGQPEVGLGITPGCGGTQRLARLIGMGKAKELLYTARGNYTAQDALAMGCDTFVTADVKYNGFLDAKALGVNLIDAGHYPTEQVVVPVLAKWLASGFPKVEVLTTQQHKEAFSYL